MDEKSMSPIKRPLTTPIPDNHNNNDNINTNNNQMKAILTKDGIIKIILPSTVTANSQEKFLSKDVTTAAIEKSASSETSRQQDRSKEITKRRNSLAKDTNIHDDDVSDEDDQYAEYKMTPRQIFCASICQVCFCYFEH